MPAVFGGANEPSSNMRKIGRLEAERSTHFQSSSSAAAHGASWIASKSPLSFRLTMTLLPARRPTRSRKAGRNEGAEAFTLYVPGSKPLAGVEALVVGEYFQVVGGRIQNFHHRAHLGNTGRAAHIARNRTGRSAAHSRKRQRNRDNPSINPSLRSISYHLTGDPSLRFTRRRMLPTGPLSAWKFCRSP